MKIFIIGSGTFGTAIANELSRDIDNEVVIFSRSKEIKDEINNLHTNKKYFPDNILNDSLVCSNDFSEIRSADIIFIALPSSVLPIVVKSFSSYISENQIIVNLSKGILLDGKTILDFLKEELTSNNIVSLKGPSFAVEIMKRAPTLLTLGYSEENQKNIIYSIFQKTCINLESTKDIIGVEMLGVIKNMYAILLGIIDVKYSSPNTRFMILSKVFKEIKILNKEFCGDTETLFLSCGFGDVCLTSFNDLSRNRTLGISIGKGLFKNVNNNIIVEGVNSVNTIFSQIDKSTVKRLPLLEKLFLFFQSESHSFELDLKLIN